MRVLIAQTAFRLTFAVPDGEGQLRALTEFADKQFQVFSGLTNCPDVCPMTLADISGWLEVTCRKVPHDDGDCAMGHISGVFLFYPDGHLADIVDFHGDRRLAVPKIRRILTRLKGAIA